MTDVKRPVKLSCRNLWKVFGAGAEDFMRRNNGAAAAEALSEMAKRGLTVTREAERDEEKWQTLAREFQQRFRTTSVPPELFDRVTSLLEEFRKR